MSLFRLCLWRWAPDDGSAIRAFVARRSWYILSIMKNKGVMIFWGVLALLIVGGFGWNIYQKHAPSKLDSFAQCMTDKGVKMYGAFWCPHCQATKKMFGSAASKIPYVECSTPDGQNQTQICKDQGVQQYPTWTRTTDANRIMGEHTLQELAEFSGCALPQ